MKKFLLCNMMQLTDFMLLRAFKQYPAIQSEMLFMLLWRLLHTYPLAIFFIIFGYIHTYSKGVFKQKWISDPKKTKDETKLFQTIVNKRSIVNCYLKELHLRCYRRPSSLSGDTRKRFSDGKN